MISMGLTEIYGPGIGISCSHDCGMHYWDDYIYIEIIDPVTGEVLPDGELGEIVITTLVKEGAPLIRYRTHDLSRIIPGECPCGSRFPRLDTIMGRTDDMMKIKGVNVFPAQIEEILKMDFLKLPVNIRSAFLILTEKTPCESMLKQMERLTSLILPNESQLPSKAA